MRVAYISCFQMLLILQSIVENGRVDRVDFAARLHNWMKCGFKELGDIGALSEYQCIIIIRTYVCQCMYVPRNFEIAQRKLENFPICAIVYKLHKSLCNL